MADTPSKFPFTMPGIRKLEPGAERYYVADTKVRGLQVLVYESGVKSFLSYRWVHGRASRIFHGRFPDINVDQARKLAEQTNAAIAMGEDPAETKKRARLEGSLQQLFDRFLEEHSKVHNRPDTVTENQRLFERHLAPWRARRLSSITRGDVERLHAEIGRKQGKIFEANRLLALLGVMFRKNIDWGSTLPNPCLGVSKFSEKGYARKRFVTESEMPIFRAALAAQGDRSFEDYVWLLLLCGARSGNTIAARWDQIDLDRALWTIPGDEHKNAEPVEVPLVPAVVAIFAKRRELTNGSPWVFPSPRTTARPISNFRPQWDQLMAATGLKNLRMHDLRRTCGSWRSEAGAQLPVIALALGRRDLKSTGVYARSRSARCARRSTPLRSKCCPVRAKSRLFHRIMR